MQAIIDFFVQITQFVINLVTSLLEFIMNLPTYVAMLTQLIGVLPFGLGVFASMLIAVGVVKLIIGRTT